MLHVCLKRDSNKPISFHRWSSGITVACKKEICLTFPPVSKSLNVILNIILTTYYLFLLALIFNVSIIGSNY